MNILTLLIKILPLIIQLMGIAEKAFADKPDSGEEKKDLVMSVVGTLFSGAETVFTGGAAATWDKIKEPVGAIIDASATIAFPHQGVIDRNDPRNM
jgi:hypothetical protein